MWNELIDIVTNKGLPTGKSALKSEIHKKGHYHNTVHIWFYTSNGDDVSEEREWVNSIMLGVGYYKRLGKKGGVSFSALYIVNYDDNRNSYGSPWVVRVGAFF